jgi:signal transduction histidine kinase
MGGALLAASEGPGKGATFTLELPAQRRKLSA